MTLTACYDQHENNSQYEELHHSVKQTQTFLLKSEYHLLLVKNQKISLKSFKTHTRQQPTNSNQTKAS